MSDDVHPVVKLLAARMESHPEEFEYKGSGRWSKFLEDLIHLATPEEKLLLRTARMNEIHADVMDELINGDERRAEEERIRAAEAAHQAAIMRQTYTQARHGLLQGQLQQLGQAGMGLAQAPTEYTTGTAIVNAIANTTALSATTQLQLGDETLDGSTLSKIKKKLGL